MNYRRAIEEYVPENEKESREKEVILSSIATYGDAILTREVEIIHMTSSGFIMNEALDKVLMIYHNIYDSWSWTGGHADGEEDMLKVALREAKEETGAVNIRALTDKSIAWEILPVNSHIKRGKYIPNHLHISAVYGLIASENDVLKVKEDENSGVRWFRVEDLDNVVSEKIMLPIYKSLVNRMRELKVVNL